MDLLRDLESDSRLHDDRWLVMVSAEIATGSARWVSAQRDELDEISSQGG
jgi:hypothetical protein